MGGGQRASRRGTSKRCWASWQVRGGGRDQQVVRCGGAGKKQGMGGRKHFDVMRFIGPSVRFQMKSVQRGPMLRDNTFLFEMFSIFTRSWSTRVSIRQGVGAAPSSGTGSHEVLARVSVPSDSAQPRPYSSSGLRIPAPLPTLPYKEPPASFRVGPAPSSLLS